MTELDPQTVRLEQAVVQVLDGADVHVTATETEIDITLLTRAAAAYRAAGRSALIELQEAPVWEQVDLDCRDRDDAERVIAKHLGPVMETAEQNGTVVAWWYMRKHPGLRLRFRPLDGAERVSTITDSLNTLKESGAIRGWVSRMYEPEQTAFGGPAAMEVAHRLFHSDSRSISRYLSGASRPDLGRPEMSVLLCAVLFRSSGLDWYEIGDVWERVALHRPDGAALEGEGWHAVKRLLSVDASPRSSLVTKGALTCVADWIAAYDSAGSSLARINADGGLARGLRSVLTHHVLFHWNRIGIPAETQASLAATAANVAFD